MKKHLFLIVLSLMFASVIRANSNDRVDHHRASTVSEELVKQKMHYLTDIKFNGDVGGKSIKNFKFIVYQKFTAKDTRGIRKFFFYKISMIYRGGDWTELENWTYDYLVIKDLDTGEQHKYSSHRR